MRLAEMKAELKKARKELQEIEDILYNERIFDSMDMASLSMAEVDRLEAANEKLITEVIVLETLLEEVGPE